MLQVQWQLQGVDISGGEECIRREELITLFIWSGQKVWQEHTHGEVSVQASSPVVSSGGLSRVMSGCLVPKTAASRSPLITSSDPADVSKAIPE